MGPVKRIFSPPKPKAPPPPKIPTEAESAAELSEASEVSKQRAFSQRGRASTLLSRGAQGDDSTGMATKKLLGGG